jgi:hypothetical protein
MAKKNKGVKREDALPEPPPREPTPVDVVHDLGSPRPQHVRSPSPIPVPAPVIPGGFGDSEDDEEEAEQRAS